MFADLFAGEWIIDTIATVPKLLSLRKSVCAALFLCNNDIDIDLPALGDCGLQFLTRMPMEIAQNLSQLEYEQIKNNPPPGVIVRPLYVRVYPNGQIAGQIIGYTGKTGRNPDGIVDNHETLWPETEGREGLEQTFNEMLTGKHGEYKLTFDKDGRKTSEKLITPPDPGYNVITTLDLRLQQLAEKALEAKAKRGAIVIIDPNNGDILALASWPTYDPNLFVPSISAEQLKVLQNDPNIPLLPRAYRSSYPPGSTFKIAVGIAALESRAVQPEDRYECVPAIQIGNVTFHNWKKGNRGALNFVQALTESCDTCRKVVKRE